MKTPRHPLNSSSFLVKSTNEQWKRYIHFAFQLLFMFGVCVPLGLAQDQASSSTTSTSQTEFDQLLETYWNWELREDSWLAMETGEDIGQDAFPSETVDDQRRRFEYRQQLLVNLMGVDVNRLSAVAQINHEVMRLRLQSSISSYTFGTFMMPLTGRSGYHLSVAELANSMTLRNKQDFENYLSRLADFPRYNAEMINLMRQGIAQGYTTPAIVLRDIASQIEPHIVSDPTASELFAPFRKPKPNNITDAEWKDLEKRTGEAIIAHVVPAYRELLAFVKQEYLPAARSSISARALPQGREFYQDQIRHFTTLDLSAAEIHQLGLNEVARIRSEMDELIAELKFDGDLESFVRSLQSDERHFAKTPEELLQFVALILKRIDGALPAAFEKLPRTPYGLKEIPSFVAPQTTSAYYWLPAADGTKAGFFYLNTYNLPQRPKYEMEALALHESVPGHHLQIALQQELEHVHPIRRFTLFTAFVEGWGLYAEWLGQEIGMYEDPYQDFGRLSMEAWRACRLVVDTGIHDMGWTRQQAIDYMRDNTALSQHNIVAEVDRYIGWPGQALGYKIGQLKILELRIEAEKELGGDFDVRGFHNAVLSNGSVPLRTLENQVRTWIRNSKSASR